MENEKWKICNIFKTKTTNTRDAWWYAWFLYEVSQYLTSFTLFEVSNFLPRGSLATIFCHVTSPPHITALFSLLLSVSFSAIFHFFSLFLCTFKNILCINKINLDMGSWFWSTSLNHYSEGFCFFFMEVPVGFLAKLWSFISFLPFFFLFFLLGVLKGMCY